MSEGCCFLNIFPVFSLFNDILNLLLKMLSVVLKYNLLCSLHALALAALSLGSFLTVLHDSARSECHEWYADKKRLFPQRPSSAGKAKGN